MGLALQTGGARVGEVSTSETTGTHSLATPSSEAGERRPVFVTTHWSVVLSARQKDSPETAAALETLCRTYWYPLYAYVRRQGAQPARCPGPDAGVLRPTVAKGLPESGRPGEGPVPHVPHRSAEAVHGE